MGAFGEIVRFIRGTRPRPPPGPKRPLAAVLLVAASLCHLPLVYLLVRAESLAPPFSMGVGLLSIGLAWSGGVSLEGRRVGTVRAISGIGAAAGVLAFVPMLVAPMGSARWLFVAGALCAGAALVVLARHAPARA